MFPEAHFNESLAIAGVIFLCIWLVSLYIIRAIFNIPSILRMHKAQVKLLEQIAKSQGVEPGEVKTIITEMQQGGW